jgi:hypothetical protein
MAWHLFVAVQAGPFEKQTSRPISHIIGLQLIIGDAAHVEPLPPMHESRCFFAEFETMRFQAIAMCVNWIQLVQPHLLRSSSISSLDCACSMFLLSST